MDGLPLDGAPPALPTLPDVPIDLHLPFALILAALFIVCALFLLGDLSK
jgi:hypothetical protein